MIIVVSSNEKSKISQVDPRFGRCKYFSVYNTETEEYSFVENEAVDANQGAGVAAAQAMINLKAEVVLTGNLGPKAFEVLAASKIKGFRTDALTIENAINDYQENKVLRINNPGSTQK